MRRRDIKPGGEYALRLDETVFHCTVTGLLDNGIVRVRYSISGTEYEADVFPRAILDRWDNTPGATTVRDSK